MIDHLQYGWQYAYLTASIFCLLMSVLTLILLRPYPIDYGFNKQDLDMSPLLTTENIEGQTAISSENQQGISIINAMKIPGMAHYTIAYAFCKATNYGILFWLPTYLKEQGLGDVYIL